MSKERKLIFVNPITARVPHSLGDTKAVAEAEWTRRWNLISWNTVSKKSPETTKTPQETIETDQPFALVPEDAKSHSPEKKQKVTELRDVLNKKAEGKQVGMQELSKDFENTFAKFPNDEQESALRTIAVMGEEELNKMSDEGKTEDAVKLMDDQEGMLRLYDEKAKQLLEERNAKAEQENNVRVANGNGTTRNEAPVAGPKPGQTNGENKSRTTDPNDEAKKQKATEIHDIVSQKADRMRELTGILTGKWMKFPKNQREIAPLLVWQIVDQELNRMSDEGKTKEAVDLIDDKEAMLRLRIQAAQQLFENTYGQKEKQNDPSKKNQSNEEEKLLSHAANSGTVESEQDNANKAAPSQEERALPQSKEAIVPVKSNPVAITTAPQTETTKPVELTPEVKKEVAPKPAAQPAPKEKKKSFFSRAKDKIASIFRRKKRKEAQEKRENAAHVAETQPSGETELIKAMTENLNREDYELIGSSIHEHIELPGDENYNGLKKETKNKHGGRLRPFLAGAVVGSLTTLLGVGAAQYYGYFPPVPIKELIVHAKNINPK